MNKMRILLFYDNFIRDYRGLLLLKEVLRRRGHHAWVEPLWTHPEETIRMRDPDTVIMGQAGEETTSKIAQFVVNHHINLVINTTEYVCTEDKTGNFFKFNFKYWNDKIIDLQVIVNSEYQQYIQNHPEIKEKWKYKFIGCPRFDLSVHPEICRVETDHINRKYKLERFSRKYLYVSSFIFDDTGGQVSPGNLKDIDTKQLYAKEKDLKRQHHQILTELIEDIRQNNDVLLIKRHPWDKSSYYQQTYSGDHVQLVDNHDYVAPLLQLCDVVLHTDSTVAIEGWIQGVKTISVLPDFGGDRSQLKNNLHFEPIARTCGEIKQLVASYPFDSTQKSLESYKPYIDGKSTFRLADLIERLTEKRAHLPFRISDQDRSRFEKKQIDDKLKTAHYLSRLRVDSYEYLHRNLEQFRRQIDEMYCGPIARFVAQNLMESIQLPQATHLAGLSAEQLEQVATDCFALLNTERRDEALQFLKAITRNTPKCSTAFHLLGKEFERAGEKRAAEALFREAVRIEPGNAKFLLSLARHLFDNDLDIKEAFALCKQVYVLRPDDVDNLWLLAIMSARNNNLDAAMRFSNAILEIEPSHQEASQMIQRAAVVKNELPQEIHFNELKADDDLTNIFEIAQRKRFGNWCVAFKGLTIFCKDLMAFYIAAKDIFIQEVYSFDADSETPRVLDGGGHIGLFTLFVKQKYPKAQITVFEPDFESLHILQKNLEANGIFDVEVIEAGLLDHEGEISFGADGSDGGSIFGENKNCTIPVVSLSPYITDGIDLLKLNIEGAECAVFKDIASQLNCVRQLVFEYHGFPETGQQLHHILSILDNAGFRYLINDFDHQTNPASKPPFKLSSETRFFLLVYAKQMREVIVSVRENKARDSSDSIVSASSGKKNPDPLIFISIRRFYENEFFYRHRQFLSGSVATVGGDLPMAAFGVERDRNTVVHFHSDEILNLEYGNKEGKRLRFDSVVIFELPVDRSVCLKLLQRSLQLLDRKGVLLIVASGVCYRLRSEEMMLSDRALGKLIQEALPGHEFDTVGFGNSGIAISLANEVPANALPTDLLRYSDPDYQIFVGAKVTPQICDIHAYKRPKTQRVLICTLWRSGTHWVANMISEAMGLPWEYTDGKNAPNEIQRSFARRHIAVRHLDNSPEDVLELADQLDFEIIFIWRDIRDVIASNVNMRKYVEGYRPNLPPFPDMEINEILRWEIEHYESTYLHDLERWVMIRHPRIHSIQYESMVNNTKSTLDGILSFLNVKISNNHLESIIEKYSFKSVSGRETGSERKDSHYRKGVIGDWKNQFDKEGRRLIAELYERSWMARQQKLSVSKVPVSRLFGFDRGKPIDRVFIEKYLRRHSREIRGRVLEVAENSYTRTFGSDVEKSDILNVEPSPNATIVGDLTTGKNIPEDAFDCIILTQTLNVVYDASGLIKNAFNALRPGGCLLLTVPGISQISRYDMDRWGDYWRFSRSSLNHLIQSVLPQCEVKIDSFGNRKVAQAFLDGFAADEVPADDFKIDQPEFAILHAACIRKSATEKCLRKRNVIVDDRLNAPLAPRVLLYHRVCDDPVDPQLLSVSPDHFRQHLSILSESFRIIPLFEMVDSLKKGRLVPGTVSITFDDGYVDNLLSATPFLEEKNIHATIFVTAGFVGTQQEFWWDALSRILLTSNRLPEVLELCTGGISGTWSTMTPRTKSRTYYKLCELLRQCASETIDQVVDEISRWAFGDRQPSPKRTILTTEELKQLSNSPVIEIGAHTMTHTRLTSIPESAQKNEITLSKKHIESMTGLPVRLFSYPFGAIGDFDTGTIFNVQAAHFSGAVSNTQRTLTPNDHPYAVPRLLVRNWNADDFKAWLHGKSSRDLEAESLMERDDRVDQLMLAGMVG